jgi:hypothetical protein
LFLAKNEDFLLLADCRRYGLLDVLASWSIAKFFALG